MVGERAQGRTRCRDIGPFMARDGRIAGVYLFFDKLRKD